MRTNALLVLMVTLFGGVTGAASQELAPWQKHIQWSLGNQGPVECPADFISHGVADCYQNQLLKDGCGDFCTNLPPGLTGRACAMARAVILAKNGQCAAAFNLAIISQCHNGAAQQDYKNIGMQAVCQELTLYSPM